MLRKKFPILLAMVIAFSMILTACAQIENQLPEEPPAPTEATSEPTSAPPEPTETPLELQPTETPPEQAATEEPDPTKPTPAAGPDPSGQNIEFWHLWGYGVQYETMQSIVEEFNANNEWLINVEAIDMGRYSDIEDAMNDAIQSGDLPNLVVAYSSSLSYWSQMDVLVDLDEFIYDQNYGLAEEDIADFYESAFNGLVLDYGTRVGFPLSQSVYVIYYNSTWAQELGFESAPTSTSELKEQACAATAKNAADDNLDNDGTGGLVMYTGSSNVVSWIYAFGEDLISEEGSGYDFTSSGIEGVASFLKEIWDDGCAFMTESYPHPEFATRKALFIMNSSVGIPYQISEFKSEDAFVDDEWVFIPFVGSDGGAAVNAFSQTIGLANTTPEQNMAAWLFLKYLSDPETQAAWINGSAYYPTRKSVTPMLTEYAAENPQWATGLGLLNIGKAEPARASWAALRREVQNTFSAILQSDPDQIASLLEELDAIAAEAVAELDQ